MSLMNPQGNLGIMNKSPMGLNFHSKDQVLSCRAHKDVINEPTGKSGDYE